MKQIVLSLLVDNNPGVLARVASLFSRRGYNIDSLSAGVTDSPKYTRITVAVSGDDQILEQIRNQIQKLEEVRKIIVLIELTGNQSKLDAFLNLMSDYEVLEMVRTGLTGLGRGMRVLKR